MGKEFVPSIYLLSTIKLWNGLKKESNQQSTTNDFIYGDVHTYWMDCGHKNIACLFDLTNHWL